VKLKALFVAAVAVAGFGASYALAGDGHGHDSAASAKSCRRSGVLGTVAAPQTFTMTVTRAGRRSSLVEGQVVTVAVGTDGQQVRLLTEGCVGTDGTLTVRGAVLQARTPRSNDGTTTTTTDSGTTTGDGGETTTTTGF
jgi:hypothetical protein